MAAWVQGLIHSVTHEGFAQLTEDTSPPALKVLAAMMYGVTSLVIVFANKLLFSTASIAFPSFKFVALCQYITTVCVMWYRNQGSSDHTSSEDKSPRRRLFPPLSRGVFWAVMPLPLVFFVNTLSGLGATMHLNVPMFVLLRRFSILMTMVLEMWLLQRAFPGLVKVSVMLMVVAAVIAAYGDLQFDLGGYAFILSNDLFTALQGVVLRKKQDEGQRRRSREVKEAEDSGIISPPDAADAQARLTTEALSSESLLYYNALFSVPLGAALWMSDAKEFRAVLHYQHWTHPLFMLCFASSMLLGFAMNFSYFLCTKVNSPLTTTVVGSMKNVVSSYVGMFIDYRYSSLNFVGLNIGVFATMLYSHTEIQKVKQSKRKRSASTALPPQLVAHDAPETAADVDDAATGGADRNRQRIASTL
jgi:solute carrier family 35 protein